MLVTYAQCPSAKKPANICLHLYCHPASKQQTRHTMTSNTQQITHTNHQSHMAAQACKQYRGACFCFQCERWHSDWFRWRQNINMQALHIVHTHTHICICDVHVWVNAFVLVLCFVPSAYVHCSIQSKPPYPKHKHNLDARRTSIHTWWWWWGWWW